MLRSYKYRLYPTPDQSRQIDKSIGVCRLVYNLALQIKIWAYQGGVHLSSFDLCYQLVDLRKAYDWVNEIDSQALQASVKKVDIAYRNFFNGKGFPKFKSKRNGGSFQCPNNIRRIDWDKSTLTIPKIKDIPIVLSRKFQGELKTVTITKTPTRKYFASILVGTKDVVVPAPKVQNAIGLDLGIAHFAVLSNGEKIENPKYLSKSIARLQVLQRSASRKKKGSQNRKKANLKVALIHEKITNQRNDFLQKISTRLIGDSQTDTICVETLTVKNMVRNHKLAQAITDASWSKFISVLEYKGKWYGKNIIKINQWFPSSKTCSNCGYVLEEGLQTGMGSSGVPVELRRIRRAKKQE